jgi:hypothetical protein
VATSLPLLLLDVDGVLNPFAAAACPPGYTEHDFFPGEEPVRLCPTHGSWLAELATRFQIAWATAWGTDANRLLAPLLQIPDLPVIAFPPVPFHPRDKLPAITRYAGHRPWSGSTMRSRPRHTLGRQPPYAHLAHQHRPRRRTHTPSH